MTEAQPINGDMRARAVMDTRLMPWEQAPSGSVWRKRVHLVGAAESGQVTSIVRYEPDSKFPSHDHPDGEEILVLEGTFCDEYETSPAGTYLLHPEGFRHQPFSPDGCILLVKLRQYAGAGRRYVNLKTHEVAWEASHEEGIEAKVLYEDSTFTDVTRLERWTPGIVLERRIYAGGAEILVLAGALEDEEGRYGEGTWLRLPPEGEHSPKSPDGCDLYIKIGGVAQLRSG